ncbi:MAG: UDP-4-amino-4,6-dideoxy-N-acetyl-beta-L-altrosamine N-acetyltransferase [Synergistaceae bacterium]|jgi:UDP-4-amino-4,6-dideoxy-N-acetyl-beta-L-altrosamine N-acetyltransferase|nr:UDP-4-amino-4,6-dideoxy-N-acetyl-beta-L-altrosamine N-acetyltransferase [Synergistaceae bacterium]
MMDLSFCPLVEENEDVWKLVLEWRNSTSIRSQMLNQSPIKWEEHCLWIAKQSGPEPRSLARVVYYESKPIGVISLNQLDVKQGHSNWGMYIGEDEMRGMGIGKAMLDEVIRWGFVDKGLRRLYTSVLANNTKAMGLYVSRGFKIEGNWRDHVLLESGRCVDLIWVGMLSPYSER